MTDPYVEALVKVGVDRVVAEQRVADQRKRGQLPELVEPKEKVVSIEELLARQFDIGTRVTNCVTHINQDLTKRPDNCLLCLFDLRNHLSLAININKYLNEWKDDATKILNGIKVGK